MANDRSKELAKKGMIVSLMVSTGTTFFLDSKKAKYLHLASGVALIGFTYWHHSLYKKEPGKLKKKAKQQIRHAGQGA